MPETLIMDEKEYLDQGHKVDVLYQRAARWRLQAPYLATYTRYREKDIRGYYFLSQEPDIEKRLENWEVLSTDDQERFSSWLVGLCYNTRKSIETCKHTLKSSILKNHVEAYYWTYIEKGKKVFESFFQLKNPRPEAVWNSSQPRVFVLPFEDAKKSTINEFLANNIQDEWKFNSWQLLLDFTPSAPVHIKFEEGATPHVNRLGGDTITMDANSPLTEFGVQWAIRHEFGHVLGFPDCYVEYYDSDEKVMVSYQIDTSNLMCSRQGRFLSIHYDALRAAYYKN